MRKASLLIAALVLGNIIYGHAQCKIFTKKRCLELIAGYTSNGQYNGAILFEGDEATMIQTFYSRQDYRLAVCAQSVLSDGVYFEVQDFKDNVLYSSEGRESNTWDFNLESTQQLKVHVVVPNLGTSNSLKQNGCVSILVGFRNEETGSTVLYPYSNTN